MRACPDPGRLARDAYTYLHLPIVAGIIGVAAGDDLLVHAPEHAPSGAGWALIAGGPALYVLGERLFRRRIDTAARPSGLPLLQPQPEGTSS
jgi:low temperature requirement protein LtrA